MVDQVHDWLLSPGYTIQQTAIRKEEAYEAQINTYRSVVWKKYRRTSLTFGKMKLKILMVTT